MAVAGIAGDEYAPNTVLLRHLDAQIPETDVVELRFHWETRCLLQQFEEVVILTRCIARNWRMKEPPLAYVHSPEELPVAVQLRLQHAIGGALREAFFELRVQITRAEYREDHALVEIRSATIDAHLVTHGGARAVAPDDKVRLEH